MSSSSDINNYFMNTLCRICAEKSYKLKSIFEIKLLPLKIYKCLPISVTAEDDLPVKICETCVSKIDESYMLYKNCYYADLKLKTLRKNFLKQPKTSEPELFFNETGKTKDILISDAGYEHECVIENSKYVPLNDEYVIDSTKNVSVILLNNGVTYDQSLNNHNFGKSEVLLPSDIIISMPDESELDVLGPAKDQIFVADNVLNIVQGCKDDDHESNNNITSVPDCSIGSNQTEEESISKKYVSGEKKQQKNELQTKIYQCKICPQQLSNISSLTIHESTHSHEKPYLCDTCGKSFKHANNLKSHVKIHSEHRKKYTCKICHKTFFTNFFLQEHMNTHTGETPYKCQVCEKEFRERVHLRQHRWTHSTEKFLCPVCGNHFNRKGNMTEHVKKYHSSNEDEKRKVKKNEMKKSSDVKYTCPICQKGFSSQIIMKNHHRRHLNKELHFCSLCGKQFRHSGSLTYHRRTAHTGEKPFQCSYCEERFSLRSVQKIHERKKHTLECPYKCTFCSRTFNNSSSLKNHSYVHMKEKLFQCDICCKKFSRNSNLVIHKKIHSDDRQYSCDQCGKSYIQKHDMIKHKKIHDPKSKPFFCKYCANAFARKKDFAKHAICQFDYIRKSNSGIDNAEKILDIVAKDLQKNSKIPYDVERPILESSEECAEKKLDKFEIT